MSVRDEHDMRNLPKASSFVKKKGKGKAAKKGNMSLLDWIGKRRKMAKGGHGKSMKEC